MRIPVAQQGTAALDDLIVAEIPHDAVSVLDLGCGTGGLAATLAARGFRVTGIDANESVLTLARRKFDHPNLNFKSGYAETVTTTIRNERFDCIVSSYAVHNFRYENALNEIAGTLKPGGKAIVIDFFADLNRPYGVSVIDQLLFSHVRYLRNVRKNLLVVGIGKCLRFVLWRIRFCLTRNGWNHMREDVASGRLLPFESVNAFFTVNWPNAYVIPIFGSVFLAVWTKENAINGSSAK